MIFVFKTTVKNKWQVRKLKPHIDNMLPNASWNFDLKDCDNILRIESEENVVDLMINLLNMHQFDCVELV